MLTVGLAKVTQVAFSGTAGNAVAVQAQQYAVSQAELVKKTAYSDLADSPRSTIAGTDFQQEISVSAESDYTNSIKQKEVVVRIYKNSERIPRASLRVLRYSIEKKDSGVPIGTIIAWASANAPSDGTWLECNGQNCTAYPELAAVLGKNTVPDYRGVFLRGLGSHTNNGITHSSGTLGVFQNMAFPQTMNGTFYTVNTSGNLPDGPFKEISQHRDYGLMDNTGYGDGLCRRVQFDFSTVVPVGNELRPVNIAVRYFIKAA